MEIQTFIITLIGTAILTALFTRLLIPRLKSHKMGQKILDIGPRWHKSKEGTPTIGGLSFMAASVVAMLLIAVYAAATGWNAQWTKMYLTYGLALVNGLIGVLDDYIKFFRHQNEGLRAWQKYLLQLLAAASYLIVMRAAGFITTALFIPYFDVTLELGVFYYFIALLLITGIVNAVNLTDGIDGLASSVTAVVAAFFAVAAFMMQSMPTALLSGVAIGACVGFLTYNFYPARIFMGDTGSLFLGGIIVGLAFMIDNPLIILVAGLLYLIECGSDILQVGYYKMTHKRIFKMAPIHHHFEKCGWSELKIVGVFSAFTAAACIAAYFGL